MRKTFATLAGVAAATIALATAAVGVTATIGNEAIDRQTRDTYQNFTIVDTNHPAAFDGYFTTVNYFAERVDVIRFVVVDANDEVTWVSAEVTPSSIGSGSVTFAEPVGVSAGSNLGVYSKNAGVISFDYANDAAPAEYERNGAGLPVVGEVLTYQGSSKRFYSMNAQVKASSPEICKNGGWESYPEYKNQGQCIASVVANANAGK